MDRQDAKPRRPSLLAGAPAPVAPGPSPARILADMAGGQTPKGRAWQGARRGWLLLSVAGVMVAGAWLLWAQRAPVEVVEPVVVQRDANADASDYGLHTGPAAATIIDEPASASMVAGASGGSPDRATPPATSPFAFAGAARTAAADHAAKPHASTGASNPFAPPKAVSGPSTPVPGRAQPATAKKTTSRSDDSGPALLATLLHNIKAGDEPGEKASGLDSLLQKMQATEAAGSGRALDSAAAPQQIRSQQIQANLRECPPPNTAKGLKCRQQICAVYAGRDPACPAL